MVVCDRIEDGSEWKMKPTVYIETTVVSYLTAWPSRDVVRLSHELITRE